MWTRKLAALSLLAMCALLAAATPATAAPIGFTVADRAGDARDPQLDLRGASVRFDSATGLLEGGVILGAPPTAQVIDSVSVSLGRSSRGSGVCATRFSVSLVMPEPGDVAAGLTQPFGRIYPGESDEPLGALPVLTQGGALSFSSAAADPAVIGALRGQRLNCANLDTGVARTFDTADQIGDQPLLSGPKPRCRIASKTVRGGRSFRFRCRGAGRKVNVHIFPQRGRDIFTGTERPRRGRFRVPTTKSMRGKAYISLFKGDTAYARYLVRIR